MKYLLLLILLSLSFCSFCQFADNTKKLNETNIYYLALTQYLQYAKTEEGRNIDTIYIETEYRLTDSLLLQSGTTKFIKLKYEDIPAFLKENKKLILYRLFPLKYENGEFSISFNPYSVTYDKKNKITNYAYSITYKVTFKFQDNKFIFQKVEGFGI
jgi:hypothetical protein